MFAKQLDIRREYAITRSMSSYTTSLASPSFLISIRPFAHGSKVLV